MKIFLRLFQILMALVISLITILIIPTIALHTSWGKKQIKDTVISFAKERGIDLKFKDIDITFPFAITAKQITGSFQNSPFAIEELSGQLSLLPLLQKQIKLSTLEISTLSLPNIPPLDLHGEAKIGKNLFFDLTMSRKDAVTLPIRVSLSTRLKNNKIFAQIIALLPEFTTLIPAYAKDLNGKMALTMSLVADPTAFKELFTAREKALPIEGSADIALGEVEIKPYKHKLSEVFIAHSKFTLFSDLSLKLDSLKIESPLLKGEMKGSFTKGFDFEQSSFAITLERLNFLQKWLLADFSGKLLFSGNINKNNLNLNLEGIPLLINYYEIKDFKANITSNLDRANLIGNFAVSLLAFKEKLDFKGDFSRKAFQELSLNNLNLSSPSYNGTGKITVDPQGFVVGSSKLHLQNLSQILALFSLPLMNADVVLTCDFKKEAEKQKFYCTGDINDLYFDDVLGKNCQIKLNLENPFTHPQGTLSIEAKQFSYHALQLEKLSLVTSNFSENWPFKLTMIGKWDNPVTINSNGLWHLKPNELLVNVQELNGELFGNPFINPSPIDLEWTSDKFSLHGLHLLLAKSSLMSDIEVSPKKTEAKIVLDHFPIDFLSLNPLDLTISGFTSMEAYFNKKEKLEGTLSLNLDEVKILSLGEGRPLNCSGKIDASYKDNKLSLLSNVRLGGAELFEMNGSLPLHLSLFPFKMHLRDGEDLKGELNFNGKVEDILDFVDMGANRLEGDLKCSLMFSGTVKDPKIEGMCDFQNGIFENYFSGTYLENLHGQVIAGNRALTLKSFEGKDRKEGKISAEGALQLDSSKDYPFNFVLQFTNLLCANSDMVTTTGNGNATISGNAKEGLALGHVDITKVDFSIPGKIAQRVPSIPYIFTEGEKVKPAKLIPASHYPFLLDINISSNNEVFISGKGVESQWQGDFHIGGTYSIPLIIGKLELKKGMFNFAGKSFELVSGELIFTGEENEIPQLSLRAKIEQKGVTIFAALSGPINTPTLSFSSTPNLSLGSIMSFLLFGQDLADISGLQAVQLASAVAAMGEGNNILEATRKSLGVDRLSVVSYPTATDDPQKVAVQVGKYITNGITISLSQGSEQGSNNVIVEVDPGSGFVFRGETEQQEEQGKFTLKWSHNY